MTRKVYLQAFDKRLGLAHLERVKTMSFTAILPNKAQSLKTHLIQGIAIGVFLTALSYALGLGFGWITELNYLEAFAVFTSYVCTFLCVVERRANYPIGAISNAAYCLLFIQWGLVASAVTTGYLTFALAYGWFRWKNDTTAIPVRHVELKWIPAYVIATAAFYFIALWAVSAAGGTLATTDTVILIGTMLAQFLLDNKRIETWLVWIVVNVFAIYTYGTAGLALAAFQYVTFLINSGYGYYMWNKSKAAVINHVPVFTEQQAASLTTENVPEFKPTVLNLEDRNGTRFKYVYKG